MGRDHFMVATSIRRRLNHDNLNERSKHAETSSANNQNVPLLGGCDHEGHPDSVNFWGTTKQECLHWAHLLVRSISQLGHCIANIVINFGSSLWDFFSISAAAEEYKNLSVNLSPLQEKRLRMLRHRTEIAFDASLVDHQDALKKLWTLAFPDREPPPLKSDLWKQMGWQGSDPSTDFRGGGYISLENMIYFGENYPNAFNRLLHKLDGERAEWEYPFALAGVNISFMVIQMLGLRSAKITSRVGRRFLELLDKDEMAFEKLYCVAFQMLDSEWLERRATYMEFNQVIEATRAKLERELTSNGVSGVEDMPAFIKLQPEQT